LSKMVLLKENIGTLSKLFVLSCCLLHVLSEFWEEAVLITVSLINTISSSYSSGLSPFKKLYEYIPDYSSFRVFGCTCFVFRPRIEWSKLSSRSVICVFLVYGENKKRYRYFDQITQRFCVLSGLVVIGAWKVRGAQNISISHTYSLLVSFPGILGLKTYTENLIFY
jgi:hypothetical protein